MTGQHYVLFCAVFVYLFICLFVCLFVYLCIGMTPDPVRYVVSSVALIASVLLWLVDASRGMQ